MRASVYILAQCAFLSIALGAEDPPPLPSYNLGITGDPTKVDTAFGNLGDVGPVYDIPEIHNESTVTSGGNSQYSTSAQITQTTEPPKIAQTTTIAQQGSLNGSNLEVTTTVEPTETEGISSQEPGIVNSTSSEAEFESSPSPNPTQTFDTTTVPTSTPNSNQTTFPKETPTSTESGGNITINTQNTTTPATTSTGPASIPTIPSSIPSSESTSTQGSMGQTTPSEPPNQTFHTGSPNSTNTPPVTSSKPGNNATKPGTNSTIPSKPNSSLYLYPTNGSIWLTLAVILFLCYE